MRKLAALAAALLSAAACMSKPSLVMVDALQNGACVAWLEYRGAAVQSAPCSVIRHAERPEVDRVLLVDQFGRVVGERRED